jgi:hypothetical protein
VKISTNDNLIQRRPACHVAAHKTEDLVGKQCRDLTISQDLAETPDLQTASSSHVRRRRLSGAATATKRGVI